MVVVKRLVIIVLFTSLISCQCVGETPPRDYYAQLLYSNDTISAYQFNIMPDSKYVLKDTIDLQAKTLVLPKGVTICKRNGGLIRNGRLIGNNTKVNSCSVIFDKVKIEGSWIVPQIKTSLFADLNYDNSLKDVIALSNPQIKNVIHIGRGIYQVSANKNADDILVLNSNTDVTIDGEIRLLPNAYPNYNIIKTNGDNIVIKGKGKIKGDKDTHLGKDGEWGMGAYVSGNNIKVRDIRIEDCWGDCIYVRGKSENIMIENCSLARGRRQGISITSAKDVTIRKCIITDVSGTAPEYGIDIEPNNGDTINRVVIDKVKVFNCKGGICSYGKAASSKINYISVSNSVIENASKTPFSFHVSNEVILKNCKAYNCKGVVGIVYQGINRGSIMKNDINMKPNMKENVTTMAIGDNTYKNIRIVDSGNIQVKE